MTTERYDVLVIGGGAAGVAAAAGAAREGARTLLVERFGFLGGAATNANVLAYCGFWTQRDPPRMGVRGIGAAVLDELQLLGLGAFAYSPLMNTMGAETSGRALAASGAGFTNAFWGLGNVIVPTLVGLVFQMTGSFPAAFVTLAVGPLLGAIGMAFVAEDVDKHPTGPPLKSCEPCHERVGQGA